MLAEVRDLRRYLMLIEAEMMARGAVAKPEDTVFKGPNYVELTEITRQAFRSALVGRDEAGVTDPNPPIISTLIGRPSAERCVPRYGGAPLPEPAGPGTPDDGGHHEPRAGRGVQALTASLVAGTYDDWPANVIISTTDPVKQGADSLHWVLDRRLWPRAEVDGFFLALPRQCSAAEFADLPPEYRGLYGADAGGVCRRIRQMSNTMRCSKCGISGEKSDILRHELICIALTCSQCAGRGYTSAPGCIYAKMDVCRYCDGTGVRGGRVAQFEAQRYAREHHRLGHG